MDDRIAQLPKQFDQMRDFLSKTIQNIHQRSLKSDLTKVKTFRDLFESRTPDSNMMWKRELCRQDPTYQFRGRWRQLADRLNTIADYTIESNLVIPITGNKHADDLRTMADLLMEVMQQMFHQAKILEYDDLLDMEDFAIFQETVSRTMQLQAISANQVCNFIQHEMVYYSQCTIEKTLDFLDYKNQLEVFLGILLQTTVKTWGKPGNCKCDYIEKLTCKHCYKYSILHQNFPDQSEAHIEELMELLESINTQTCDCSYHATLPMHGPSKYIKEPIPTYEKIQQLHQQVDPNLLRSDLQVLYVNAIISWIYARLFQYLTPYTDPTMNKKVGFSKPVDWDFHHGERAFIENRLCLMETEVNYHTRGKKMDHLADLKKAYRSCETHQEDRVINLLYQLKFPNTSPNRKLIQQVLRRTTTWIFCSYQFLSTNHWYSQCICELILYEITSSYDGTFEAVKQASRKQPHTTVKDTFFDIAGTSFIYVCSDKGEEQTISNLFSEVKGLPMVVNATDGLESFFGEVDVDEESELLYQTPTSTEGSDTGIPDLVNCDGESFLDQLDSNLYSSNFIFPRGIPGAFCTVISVRIT